ncbi:MAG: DUF1015 domain-containing protein [Planctomycetota bacterium]|nr:DUF1015 domain-containing protein [Planctomycetota bacterium]
MANIQALPGLRYDLAKIGALSEVVAPPYDVIGKEFQDQLYALHPHNVIRLILNRGDHLDGEETVYTAAGKEMKQWRRDGILKEDYPSAVYVYHQIFMNEGEPVTRRGFMSRVLLEPFGEGHIYPHEETHSKAKEDRFRLMSACQANLSPIFGIYPDETNEAQEILEAAIDDATPLQARDHLGVEHKVWLVTDPAAIAKAAQVMGDKPVYIADGHHRYETSCNIQKAKAEAGELSPDDPANYVLMMNVSMFDPGMIVLPTHRLFRGLPAIESADLMQRLSIGFDCTVVGQGPGLAGLVWQDIELEDRQSTLAFYCHADDTWVMVRLNDQGVQLMNELAPDQSDEWRSLGVAILHNLVMAKLLDKPDLPTPLYVHSVDEVVEHLQQGDAAGRDATGQQGSGEPFQLCCLVMPASLAHVKAISEAGERMPAKSTYFYPKLLSGLVINPIG